MTGVGLLSLPVFGIVALGWAATRARLATAGALDALGAFAFRFALPALVLRLIAGQPLGTSFHPAFYGGYLASGGLLFAVVLGLSRVLGGRDATAAGAHATASTVGNLGFLGPPLVLAFLGERGAGPLAMAILAEIMVLLSVGTVLMAGSRDAGVGSAVLRSTVRNPVLVAVVLGAAAAAAGAAPPEPLDRFLGLLGGAAAPTALFALGGALALQRIDRATVRTAAAITLAKLVASPVLAWLVLDRLLRVEPFWVQAGVLLAALPPAGNVYVVAQRYAADADRVSAAIALATTLSAVTVPVTAWLVVR